MKNSEVYHERQKLQFCLVHSLNSLFQQKDAFTREKLNGISERLALEDSSTETWTPFSVLFKPHHNVFTGNYDINVLIAALEEKGKSVVWHDRRKGASCIDLDAPVLMGIVINVSVTRFGGIWKSRHWIALRKIDGVWFNLDSDLPAPLPFHDAHKVREFLDFTLAQGGEILIVLNEKQSWKFEVNDSFRVKFGHPCVQYQTDCISMENVASPIVSLRIFSEFVVNNGWNCFWRMFFIGDSVLSVIHLSLVSMCVCTSFEPLGNTCVFLSWTVAYTKFTMELL